MDKESDREAGMVEALEKGINEADGVGQISDKERKLLDEQAAKLKKPKGKNSDLFKKLRENIAERQKALDET